MEPIESQDHPGWYHVKNFEGFETVLINKKGQVLNLKTNKVSNGAFVGHYYKVYIPNTKNKYIYTG